MDNENLDEQLTKKYRSLTVCVIHYLKENNKGPFAFEYNNRSQGLILHILNHEERISQKELVENLHMRPQSVSELIRKLEAKNYIIRTKLEEDKRVMMIELTDEGRKLINEKSDIEPITECLTEEEKRQFEHILSKMIDNIKPKLKKTTKTYYEDE